MPSWRPAAATPSGLKTDGTLWAWGWNDHGQLGYETPFAPLGLVPTQLASGFASVAAGGYHSLALEPDGSLWAWGANGFGQLGFVVARPVPVP